MKIKSTRTLAIELSHGAVDFLSLSKSLHRVVALWAKRGEVVIADGKVRMAV
jgi:hypothetical protein